MCKECVKKKRRVWRDFTPPSQKASAVRVGMNARRIPPHFPPAKRQDPVDFLPKLTAFLHIPHKGITSFS
jgi:hypothetical protein